MEIPTRLLRALRNGFNLGTRHRCSHSPIGSSDPLRESPDPVEVLARQRRVARDTSCSRRNDGLIADVDAAARNLCAWS